MLLLIDPARDGGHNTYICRGSDRQIEPLGPDVESPLHSCWDKITVKNRRGGFLDARGGVPEPLEPSPGYAPGNRQNCILSVAEKNAVYSVIPGPQ